MLHLHYWPTPNGKKVTIFLEEAGLSMGAASTGAPSIGRPSMGSSMAFRQMAPPSMTAPIMSGGFSMSGQLAPAGSGKPPASPGHV